MKNINISQVQYDIDALCNLTPLSNEDKDYIRKNLDIANSSPRETITFDLIDVDVSIANAIRRSVISDTKYKCIAPSLHMIDKNQRYSSFDLKLRIRMLPIDHDCPLTTTFTMDILNDTQERMTVYSSHIKASDNKTYMLPNFPIIDLDPGNYIKITNMPVKEKNNYNNASWSMCSDFTYKTLDYVEADFLYKKTIVDKMVRTIDLKKHIKYKHGDRVLIIFDPDLMNFHNMDKWIKYYDHIIENNKSQLDYEFIPPIQSSVESPREFRISFTTNGNMPAKWMLTESMMHIISVITEIKESIEYCQKNNVQKYNIVDIEYHDPAMKVLITGHSHTISRLLMNHILALIPNIRFVNIDTGHYSTRSFMLNIVHSEPMKILIDVCDKINDTFHNLISDVK